MTPRYLTLLCWLTAGSTTFDLTGRRVDSRFKGLVVRDGRLLLQR